MVLGFNLDFADLNNLDGLIKLDHIWLDFLNQHGQKLSDVLIKARSNPDEIVEKDYSDLIISISPVLDDFLAELFLIENEINASRLLHKEFDIIYECKRKFIQRIAIKKYPHDRLADIDFSNISNSLKELLGCNITNHILAQKIIYWQSKQNVYEKELDIAAQYAAFMVHNGSNNVLFNFPELIDKSNLISSKKIEKYKENIRIGFDYFDPELNIENSLNNSHYCIYCHNQSKDSCSKGLVSKMVEKNLTGCPLKQKISEMNYTKARGFNLSALAIIVIDNPMVASTGHRICNDCMNSCIYQKQDPVNVPLIESDILGTVLNFSYGLEIYLLLTKWNPLNIKTPLPLKSSGYNVLITGLGPAGFSLAHYLLNEGHNVVAIDGLKISPLPFDAKLAIKDWSSYKQKLSTKLPQGFGGVAEYGITARWDKNNLTIIRLILERRSNFKMYSGIRLGSNITKSQAFELGFDHIAICTGAGAPKFSKLENFLAKGVRTASDFLMSLQSSGAFLEGSIANLTIRMPIAVIGCGLTAIDAAVETLNYYPIQVEKFAKKYTESVLNFGIDYVERNWNEEDKLIALEFLAHAELFNKQQTKEGVRKVLLDKIGAVTIYYRGLLKNSPAYKLNIEEVIQAISHGVNFAENMTPLKINVDKYGYSESIDFGDQVLPAKTIIVAIGTETNLPNTIDNSKYSYFGDASLEFSGSVVKALASSKYGYKIVTTNLNKQGANFSGYYKEFFEKLDNLLISTIAKINILSDKIVELIIHSPLAAKNFKPGQFFRLQNYATTSTRLIEPLALTGAYVDEEKGLVSLIVLEIGESTKLCRTLSVGEKIILMGPTGEPTKIVKDSNVILVGGGLGNAVLFSIGKALRENGCCVTYVAGYRNLKDRFYPDKIEGASDKVIWCCEEGVLEKNRSQDISIKGNVIDGLRTILSSIPHRVICIGSDSMMKAVTDIKKELFPDDCKLICSINSPMQCMMKGICGQCVQATSNSNGYIFSCICQDQEGQIIDFDNLKYRLQQNSLQEKSYSPSIS